MSWSKLFKPVEMPDKDDPKYKETYEREVAAGEKFAQVVGITWLAKHLQRLGSAHKKLFLGLAFGFVILLFILNVVRMIRVSSGQHRRAVAVERIDNALEKRHHVEPLNNRQYGTDKQKN